MLVAPVVTEEAVPENTVTVSLVPSPVVILPAKAALSGGPDFVDDDDSRPRLAPSGDRAVADEPRSDEAGPLVIVAEVVLVLTVGGTGVVARLPAGVVALLGGGDIPIRANAAAVESTGAGAAAPAEGNDDGNIPLPLTDRVGTWRCDGEVEVAPGDAPAIPGAAGGRPEASFEGDCDVGWGGGVWKGVAVTLSGIALGVCKVLTPPDILSRPAKGSAGSKATGTTGDGGTVTPYGDTAPKALVPAVVLCGNKAEGGTLCCCWCCCKGCGGNPSPGDAPAGIMCGGPPLGKG